MSNAQSKMTKTEMTEMERSMFNVAAYQWDKGDDKPDNIVTALQCGATTYMWWEDNCARPPFQTYVDFILAEEGEDDQYPAEQPEWMTFDDDEPSDQRGYGLFPKDICWATLQAEWAALTAERRDELVAEWDALQEEMEDWVWDGNLGNLVPPGSNTDHPLAEGEAEEDE